MQPQELTALITGVANLIYTRCPPEQVATLSIVLIQLGTTLGNLLALGNPDSDQEPPVV